MKTPSAYNVILGRPELNTFHAIVFIYYLLMIFLTARGVGEVCKNQALEKQCYTVSLQAKLPDTILVEGLDTHDELTEEQGELAKDLLIIPYMISTLNTPSTLILDWTKP